MARSRRIVVVLYNVRSAHNVGSIFRTCDALAIEKIFLCGITPLPGQGGRAGKDLAKTALGAEKTVAWEHVRRAADCLKRLKREGFTVVALEQDARAVDITKFRTKRDVALVLGTEVTGIAHALLRHCDAIVEIPMWGTKESLNVSVAFGIAGYLIKLQ